MTDEDWDEIMYLNYLSEQEANQTKINKVAKRSLDQETINALSDQATRLHDEALLLQSNKKPQPQTNIWEDS